jgi:hypothetical protein
MTLVHSSDIAPLLRDMLIRILEQQRRFAGAEMRGKVTDVDTSAKKARIAIGTDSDGNPVKSPWVPYAQIAGDLKFHQPPSVGQVMSLRSENGDIEQGVLDPYHFSDDNPSPSADANSNVLTFGSVKVTLGQSSIEVDIGGTVYTFAAAGFDQTGGYQKHNGTHVDDTHVHGGVIPGGADTEPPAN